MTELHSAVVENFSLTRGGPFYRLQQRLGASGVDNRARVVRRALLVTLLTWLPLLLFSLMQGLAYGSAVAIPFLYDFAANVRFLIALPFLILAETGIDRKLGNMVLYFLKSGLVQEAELPAFEAVLEKITRLRDRALPEVVMVVLALLPSWSIRHAEILGGAPNWHSLSGLGVTLSFAGWWFGLVSAPVFRFLLARWLWRMFLWSLFLRRVSRLDLRLMPTHADMAAGLGFLAEGQRRFSPIVFAGGAVIAAQVGNAIAYEGASVGSLKFIMIGYCVFAILLLVSPLLLVAPKLFKVKKAGLLEYGALETAYAQAFDSKWVHGRPPEGETLLGSADIQSLADLGNSFAIVREMNIVPVNKRTLIGLALAAVLPMAPVLILATPADQLIGAVVKMLL